MRCTSANRIDEKRRRRAVVAGLLSFAAFAALRADEARTIDARDWQLFLDNHAIARATGFDRVLHHPVARGIVISNDRPWETDGVAPVYFGRKRDGAFFCYYDAIWWAPRTEARSASITQMIYADGAWRTRRHDPRPPDYAQQYVGSIAYATSRDGIHWEKPDLGLVEAPTGVDWKRYPPYPFPLGASRANNLDLAVDFVDLGRFGNVSDPAKRFAINVGGHAYFSPELPDIAHDPHWRDRLVDSGGTFSPRGSTLSFWDEGHREWVAIVQNAVPHWLPTREIARFSSPDLKHWRSDIVLAPDPEDRHNPLDYEEPMSLYPFSADGAVLGILSWFHGDRTTADGGPVLDPGSAESRLWPEAKDGEQGWPWPTSPSHPYVWPWERKGVNEMRITISRDGGRTWDRTVSREAWIPHGTEQDSYDRLIISACPPLRVGDEDWFYMGVWNGDHLSSRADANENNYYHDRLRRGRIALYTQKHDRYVSLSTGTQIETLITRPFILSGDTLHLNVDATRGRVLVGIAGYKPVPTLRKRGAASGGALSLAPHLLEEDNMIPGFGLEDCLPVLVDRTDCTVAFRQGASLAPLRGRTVVLCVEMLDSDLYGFKVD